jgi:hypothetical protein
MKTRMLAAVLMTLALVISSVAVGHAGGGAGESITDTFFDCWEIQNGSNSPYTLAVTDRFGDHTVRLGKSRLLCTPTSAISVERGPTPSAPPAEASEIKCYDVLGTQPKGPREAITLTDSLGEETVTLKKLSILCTPVATDPAIPQ